MKRQVVRVGAFSAGTALVVVLYVFLLSVFRGRLGVWSSAVPAIVLAIGLTILTTVFLRLEGWSFETIGLRPARSGVAALGYLFGVAVAGVWVLIFVSVVRGHWRTESMKLDAAIAAVVFLLCNNLAEELAYRAYGFLMLRRLFGAGAALLLTSGLFALLHMQGGVPWQSALAVVFPTALLYGALFLRTSNTLFVWMVHVATNMAQELFGLRRSALTFWLFEPFGALSERQSTLTLLMIGVVTTVVAGAVLLMPPSRTHVWKWLSTPGAKARL